MIKSSPLHCVRRRREGAPTMRRGLLIASAGALIVGGCLAPAGVVGVAWMLLSANSPL